MTLQSSAASMELSRLEMEAKCTAGKHVANLLQRPDQLEKVDQYRRRVARKKASVEAMLKTAVQSQLDGVRTGLVQLHNALQDVKDIKQSLEEAESTHHGINDLQNSLKKVREENSRHSQLAAAVENLKHIFNVPESVKNTADLINDGKLLHAHRCLNDLETSRDDLLFELYKQPQQSPTDKNTLKHYFAEVETLSDMLAKQLWLVLSRTLLTIRREPTIIVTALRIIEREERKDAAMLKRKEMTGFMAAGRPKKWRERCFRVLEEAVQSRVEGSQLEDRDMDKMWLVRHFELTRQIVVDDIKVVKKCFPPCFPADYDIVQRYVNMYHEAISHHLEDIVSQGLEGNEIVSLLQWVHAYTGPDMMGHKELEIDLDKLGPLIDNKLVDGLQDQYLTTMRSNFQEWMSNSLKSDLKDWYRDEEPEADAEGYFNTALPVILFQMIEQNLTVASAISEGLALKALDVCIDEMLFFARTYRVGLTNYKDKHLQGRSEEKYEPRFYIHYVIGNINNCNAIVDFTDSLKGRYCKDQEEPDANDRFSAMAAEFNKIATDFCGFLLSEVFLDLQTHVNDLFTRKWVQVPIAVDTICITLEDYNQDFVHLKPRYYDSLMVQAQHKILLDYLKALMGKKMSFKTYEERREAAEKMCREAAQIGQLFGRLVKSSSAEESPFEVIMMLAEVLKLKDTSMMSLELSGLLTKYPDIRSDQLVNLLLLRGDVNKSEARQMVSELFGEGEQPKPSEKTIFSQFQVSTGLL